RRLHATRVNAQQRLISFERAVTPRCDAITSSPRNCRRESYIADGIRHRRSSQKPSSHPQCTTTTELEGLVAQSSVVRCLGIMGTLATEALGRARPGRVLTLYCSSVDDGGHQLREATEELAPTPTLVALEWQQAPSLARELYEIRDVIADWRRFL